MKINKLSMVAICIAFAPPVYAQNSSKPENSIYPPSAINRPYWADMPMIEIIGRANGEFDANRVKLNFSIKETNSDSQIALKKLNDKSRSMILSLQKLIGKKGDVEISYFLSPIYQQYKNSDGVKISNQREDKIENYIARYEFNIYLYDVTLAPKVKANILSIKDAQMVGTPEYSFEPTLEQSRSVFGMALEDGKARAKMVALLYDFKLRLLTFGEGQDDCKSAPSSVTAVERSTIAPIQIDVPDPVERFVVDTSEPNDNYTSQKPAMLASELVLPSAPSKNIVEASVCMVFSIE